MELENENIDMSVLLLRYINSEATPDDIVEIENWIKADKANLLFLQNLRIENELAKTIVNSIEFDSTSAYFNFNERIKKQKQKRITKIYLSVASIAALLLLVFGLTNYFSNVSTNKLNNTIEHVAKLDSISKIILPDSSQVFLNNGSKLSYTDTYNKQTRDVSISGEAFLSVTHDSLKPFNVHIEGVLIQVKGTSFSVYHDSSNHQVIVSVKTGKVMVASKRNEIMITQSEQVSIDLQNQKIVKTSTPSLNYDAWLTGVLKFNNSMLIDVVESLNKNFKTNLVIASSELEKKAVYATFYKKDDIETILQTLQLGLSVEIKKENGKYLLYETH